MTPEAKKLLAEKPELCGELAICFVGEIKLEEITPMNKRWTDFVQKNTEQKDIEKLKPVLFTTEDGVGIADGQDFWSDIDGNAKTTKASTETMGYGWFSMYKHFSTQQIAEEHIFINKPCLSVQDIIDVRNELSLLKYSGAPTYEIFFSKIKNVAKLKQNHE